MFVTVAETPSFIAQAAKLLSDAEKFVLIDLISKDPTAGVLIPGTGGLRKIRIGLDGRGKRGGGRVVYWFHSSDYPAVLLWVLAKNAASDLSPDQTKKVKAVADGLLKDFGAK